MVTNNISIFIYLSYPKICMKQFGNCNTNITNNKTRIKFQISLQFLSLDSIPHPT